MRSEERDALLCASLLFNRPSHSKEGPKIKGPAQLQQLIDNGEMAVAIGAHDAFSAVLVERAGFNAVYIGSFATEATFLGQPIWR